MLDPVTGVITAPHYWYEIGINQGTDHSFSRSYRGDGDFTLEKWAEERLSGYNYVERTNMKVVPLMTNQLCTLNDESGIVEVVWFIGKEEMTPEEIEGHNSYNAEQKAKKPINRTRVDIEYPDRVADVEPWEDEEC